MEQIGCLTEKSNSADRSADQTEASTPEPPVLDAAVIEYIVELLGPIEESAE